MPASGEIGASSEQDRHRLYARISAGMQPNSCVKPRQQLRGPRPSSSCPAPSLRLTSCLGPAPQQPAVLSLVWVPHSALRQQIPVVVAAAFHVSPPDATGARQQAHCRLCNKLQSSLSFLPCFPEVYLEAGLQSVVCVCVSVPALC